MDMIALFGINTRRLQPLLVVFLKTLSKLYFQFLFHKVVSEAYGDILKGTEDYSEMLFASDS